MDELPNTARTYRIGSQHGEWSGMWQLLAERGRYHNKAGAQDTLNARRKNVAVAPHHSMGLDLGSWRLAHGRTDDSRSSLRPDLTEQMPHHQRRPEHGKEHADDTQNHAETTDDARDDDQE